MRSLGCVQKPLRCRGAQLLVRSGGLLRVVKAHHSGQAGDASRSVQMTRLSCHGFRCNELRLALSLLAYNLGNQWRRLALSRRIENWSMASLPRRIVKTGRRLVKHARYYWLLLAEGHLNSAIRPNMAANRSGFSGTTGVADAGQFVSTSLFYSRLS